MSKVVVGLSGGVDSSVAAYMLKKEGHDVKAMFMKNWHDRTGLLSSECNEDEDRFIAGLAAKKLDIPFHEVDLSEQYRKRVVDYMFAEYSVGRTPNPDVLCNREIKFDIFMDKALELGADFVATGHYCRKETLKKDQKTIYRLFAGIDRNKDQSYFLCQLNQKQLEKAMFPIGHLTKPQVRKIATEQQLPTAERKDSQGICFVGKVNLPEFLQQQLQAKKGDIIRIEASHPVYSQKNTKKNNMDKKSLHALACPHVYEPGFGRKVGIHNGAHFYTVGQRKGLDVGGTKEPLYVIATDISRNIVYVGEGQHHPGLYRKALSLKHEDIHWIRPDLCLKPGNGESFLVRIRYRQPLQKARLYIFESAAYIVFDELQRGITPGQFAAWYDGDELIGSGVIE